MQIGVLQTRFWRRYCPSSSQAYIHGSEVPPSGAGRGHGHCANIRPARAKSLRNQSSSLSGLCARKGGARLPTDLGHLASQPASRPAARTAHRCCPPAEPTPEPLWLGILDAQGERGLDSPPPGPGLATVTIYIGRKWPQFPTEAHDGVQHAGKMTLGYSVGCGCPLILDHRVGDEAGSSHRELYCKCRRTQDRLSIWRRWAG